MLYAGFVFEMCIIIMNLTIGLSISNIQATAFLGYVRGVAYM